MLNFIPISPFPLILNKIILVMIIGFLSFNLRLPGRFPSDVWDISEFVIKSPSTAYLPDNRFPDPVMWSSGEFLASPYRPKWSNFFHIFAIYDFEKK